MGKAKATANSESVFVFMYLSDNDELNYKWTRTSFGIRTLVNSEDQFGKTIRVHRQYVFEIPSTGPVSLVKVRQKTNAGFTEEAELKVNFNNVPHPNTQRLEFQEKALHIIEVCDGLADEYDSPARNLYQPGLPTPETSPSSKTDVGKRNPSNRSGTRSSTLTCPTRTR